MSERVSIDAISPEDCEAVRMEHCRCDINPSISSWIEQLDWIDWYDVCTEVMLRCRGTGSMTWSEYISVREALCKCANHVKPAGRGGRGLMGKVSSVDVSEESEYGFNRPESEKPFVKSLSEL